MNIRWENGCKNMVIFMISDWVWRVLNMILINTTIFCPSKTCVEKHFFHFILLESKLNRHFKWWRLMIIKTKQKVILEFIVKFWKSRSNPKKSLNKPNNRKLIYYILYDHTKQDKMHAKFQLNYHQKNSI